MRSTQVYHCQGLREWRFPQTEREYFLYVCPSICLSACPSIRLSICPSVCAFSNLSVHLFIGFIIVLYGMTEMKIIILHVEKLQVSMCVMMHNAVNAYTVYGHFGICRYVSSLVYFNPLKSLILAYFNGLKSFILLI